MKRIIALILAAILLCASCIALADEEKPNGFEVTFSFEKDMRFKGVTSINNFLISWPLSKMEIKEYEWAFGFVTEGLNGVITAQYPITGFSNCVIYGERDETASLHYYQIDACVSYTTQGETWDTYLEQWKNEHPNANLTRISHATITLDGKDALFALFVYYETNH